MPEKIIHWLPFQPIWLSQDIVLFIFRSKIRFPTSVTTNITLTFDISFTIID